jgi:MFS transporter, SHS family, lactate transporter
MSVLSALRELNHEQRHTVLASFLGWTLDAFDFFLFTFVIVAISKDFGVDRGDVTLGVLLTLAARPLGALIFGRLADRYGRRPVLMIDVVLFSVFELATAFAPSLVLLLIMRFMFGVAMGGEWGIGASLAMETIPAKSRGLVSGLLQSGYPCGFFLAALVNWLLIDHIGWRGLFVVGAVPAVLVLYIRRKVPESPAWEAARAKHGRVNLLDAMRGHWKLAIYLMCLMAAFNMFSHGSQDMYPTFEQVNLHLPAGSGAAFMLVALLNLGALVGGICFGAWSEKIGRRRAIIIAALLAIPVVPLWTYGGSFLLLGLGAFLIQVMVQGAWGVVPTHLNELSPDAVRGTLPGFAYQMGNLIAAGTAWAQVRLAGMGWGLPAVMSIWIVLVALLLALLVWLGPEARGRGFGS